MADNTALNAGTGGDTIATDDCAGIKYQLVKLVDGTADSTTVIPGGAAGLKVNLASTGANATAIIVDGSAVTQPVSIATVPSHAVTNAGTFAVQVSSQVPGTAATNLGKAEDAAHSSGDVGVMLLAVREATATDLSAGNTDGDYEPLQVDANGKLHVNPGTVTVTGTVTSNAGTNLNTSLLALEAGGNLATVAALSKAEDAAHASGNTGVMALAVRNATVTDLSVGNTDGDYEPLQVSAAGRLWTSTTVDSALPAGTNAIGKLASNSGVTIGAVEIAAAQTLATVTTVSTVTTATTLTGSGIAHDGADSGNPHKIGMRAKSSLTAITLVAADDRSDTFCDVDGVTIVKTGAPSANVVSERVSNTDGSSTAFSTFGAAANLRNFITAVTVHNAHATTNGYVDFRDGTAGSIIWTFPLPATGGTTLNFDPPLRQPTANTALAFDVSAAITTVYISVNGFQSKA